MTLITRGFGQTVTLEPYLFAEVNTKYLFKLHAIFFCYRTQTTLTSSMKAWSSAGFAGSWGSSGRWTPRRTAPVLSFTRTGTSSPMTGSLTWLGAASATAQVSKLL